MSRLAPRFVMFLYLGVLLLIPVGGVFYRTFERGVSFFLDSITTPAAESAFQLTLELAVIAVALNTVLGLITALALARRDFRGKAILEAIIDLPFAVSPVVVGLALVLTFGRPGWIHLPFKVVYAFPGLVLATVFITVPFVVREVTPVLRELGDEQEQAAATLGASSWQIFWRITLPNIRYGLTYGVVLSVARAIGEFGAVSVVSANVAGSSQTLTLLVQARADAYGRDALSGAYAAAGLLAVIALAVLLVLTRVKPQEGPGPMIDVKNLVKHYGDYLALDDVSLEVKPGSLTALLGPSGSGKSTLLRSIAGLESVESGSVVIDGNDVTHVKPQDRGIGFVFQHYAAFKHMSVRDNVGFGPKIRKRSKAEIKATVDELLGVVGLSGYADRYPTQLSGGQRQRMALARALAVEPRVLLLDEPFGALDAKVRAELRTWLRRLHERVPVTTVLVTHDQQEALDVADRIAVLDAGHIEQVGSPRELYDAPRQPVRDGLPRGGRAAPERAGPPARPLALARAGRRRARGAGRARRAPGLRGPGGAGARRRGPARCTRS